MRFLPDRWRELMLEHQNNNWLETITTPRPKIKLQPIAPHPSTPLDLPGPKRAKPRRKRARENSSLPLTSDSSKNKDNNSSVRSFSASTCQCPVELDVEIEVENDGLQQNQQNGQKATENESKIIEVGMEADKDQVDFSYFQFDAYFSNG